MSFTLRPDQQAVVAYRGGYMAVPAVPGAGKTTVLAALAADLIAEGRPAPGRVLIVTYTNSAVGNFKSRIGEFLERRGLPRQQGYEVRTIHSLAMNIVRDRAEAIGWTESFTVLDEVRLQELLTRLTRGFIGRNRALWESQIRPNVPNRQRAEEQWEERTVAIMRSLIQALKARRLAPAIAFDLTGHLPEDSMLRWAAELYPDYQRELAMLGVVDYSDLILGAQQLLAQDQELLHRLRRRWTFICEDEAQDSYRLQEQVLKLLAGPEGNLVRVGDANQAIMGTFTSAEPDLFRRFAREPGVERRPLTMAGRSSPDVIDLANELVRWSRTEHPEPACREALEAQLIAPVEPGFGQTNPAPEGYRIVAKTYDSYEQELQGVARLAARSQSRSPEMTLAILLPTNAMVGSMLEVLGKLGAPARQLGGPTVPERLQTVQDLLAVLHFLAAPHESDRLLTALSALLRRPLADEPALADTVRRCRPEELFYPLGGSPPLTALWRACPAGEGDAALAEAIHNLARWLALAGQPADGLLVTLAADLGLAGEELATVHHLAVRARQHLGAAPALGLDELLHLLLAEQPALGKFADALYDRQGFRPEPGIIYVTTCHGAKGLEWDTVYVAALTRGEYPAMMQDKVRSELWFLPDGRLNPEALALAELEAVLGEEMATDAPARAKAELLCERLRLLYVAITRARVNLLLSCHLKDRWGKGAHPTLAFRQLKDHIERKGAV